MYRIREGSVNNAHLVDSIAKSPTSRKTYFLFWRFVHRARLPLGWKEHASETRGNFSPLFNGNAVLLGSGAQTDRTFIGRKGFKLAREMYLYPLTQIADGLSAVSTYRASALNARASVWKESVNIQIFQLVESARQGQAIASKYVTRIRAYGGD